MNVLIIEDDALLAQNVQKSLMIQNEDYRSSVISSPAEFIDEIQRIGDYDLILVDLQLTPRDSMDTLWGYKIISTIREMGYSVPIIVMSGKAEIECLEKSFDLGANDYLIKPIRLKEVGIRINNWIGQYQNPGKKLHPAINPYNGLRYADDIGEFYYRGTQIPLTKVSKIILLTLFRKPKLIVKEYEIIESVWGDFEKNSERNLRVNMMRLKKSLARVGINSWIQNIRGEGYMLL